MRSFPILSFQSIFLVEFRILNRFQGAFSCSKLTQRTLFRYANGQQHIMRKREKSTIILVSIVLAFISCHTLRIILQVGEKRKSA